MLPYVFLFEKHRQSKTKKASLQTSLYLLIAMFYFSTMTKRQLVIAYSIIIFIMVWGIELINAIKFRIPITLHDVFNVFTFSQITYAVVTFLLIRVAFTKYFTTRKYGLLALSVAGIMLGFIVLRYSLEEMIYPVLLNSRNYSPNTPLFYYFLDNVYYALVYMFLGFLIFLLDNQIVSQKKQALLVQQTREAELQFLRSQINPHFLFNTLNNIYSLVHDQSKRAPGAILKLAELMRYMLYEKKEMVPLTKEWDYVSNFISLQQLRFEEDIPVIITVKGDPAGKEIPTYLLIPFIENAFKHGDFKDQANPLTIQLTVTEKNILFRVKNKINHYHKDSTGGVGLDNIKRRLELMYGGKHLLETSIEGDNFVATLELKGMA